MRVLLDENVDRRLGGPPNEEHEVVTIAERGRRGKSNGDLLTLAQREFDVLVSTDKGIPYQQNLSRFDIAVVILRAKSNRFEDLSPLAQQLPAILPKTRPGEAILIED